MKTPAQLLNAYLDNIQNPAVAAALFAEDGVLELPSLGPQVRAVGPVVITASLAFTQD